MPRKGSCRGGRACGDGGGSCGSSARERDDPGCAPQRRNARRARRDDRSRPGPAPGADLDPGAWTRQAPAPLLVRTSPELDVPRPSTGSTTGLGSAEGDRRPRGEARCRRRLLAPLQRRSARAFPAASPARRAAPGSRTIPAGDLPRRPAEGWQAAVRGDRQPLARTSNAGARRGGEKGSLVGGGSYRRAVRRAVSMSLGPYGYTVTIWTSGGVLIHARGAPNAIDALLFMLGAVAGFASVGIASF